MARRTKRPPTPGANHLEWLRLVEVSGPFLSLPVLKEALPQGLEADDRDVRAELKAAHSEWTEKAHDRAYHTQWIRFVLGRALELGPEVLVDGPRVPANLRVRVAVHHEDLRPDFAVLGFAESGERPTRLAVQVFDAGTDLERPVDGARWKASPVTRMVELLRGVPDGGPTLGLVTNGEQWVLVSAPRKGTTTFVTWHASLWFEEKITLQALRTLFGARRVFGPVDETLERLIERSAEHQHDVTIQLGLQVREAIELLVRRIDELDRGSGRILLEGVTEKQVYEAAVTVMMRLVFVFYLEEQADLYFPVAKSNFYQRHYALSPLGASLRAEADRLGPDVLERRTSAWCRLLATFRAIHGGVAHVDMRLPAYGGHLFDPDRFPFLEGRKPGQGWRTNAAAPLAIDDATVLFVLEALQVLRVRDGGANGAETRRLSFRELGVEQIGNVYESLLDHTAKRADDAVVSLKASKGEEPEIELRELEQRYDPIDTSKLVSFVKERTGRTEPSIAKDLEYTIDEDSSRWLVACGNDSELYGRVKPVAGLVREDRRKQPVVYPKDSIYVTAGADRRSTGTHYTPPSLTEPVVRYALEPLVYVGPAEGKPESEWMLKSPREILALRVCDLACGSGAFLVQACRYLAERLVEAWARLEAANPGRLLITPEGDLSTGAPGERIIPKDAIEREAIARRVIADRCLYGVDVNPMAVEMAKLSLWLTTLQREKPFGFLDHSLRSGDSLLGLTSHRQLEQLSLTATGGNSVLSTVAVRSALARSRSIRESLRAITVETVQDVERKASLLAEADGILGDLVAIADALIVQYRDAYSLQGTARRERLATNVVQDLASDAVAVLDENAAREECEAAGQRMRRHSVVTAERLEPRRDSHHHPFHWSLRFPEVFEADRTGFDAIVGNPPFLGNKYWKSSLGSEVQFAKELLTGPESGKIDLATLFVRRSSDLLAAPGCVGLLGTSKLCEGQSLDVGLAAIADQYVLYRATTAFPWPGAATISAIIVWFAQKPFQAPPMLDGRPVERIKPQLESTDDHLDAPAPLASGLFAFEGVHNGRGLAFTVALDDPWFSRLRESGGELFQPYLSGDDLLSHGLQRIDRWAVFTRDLSLEDVRARSEVVYQFLIERVKPTRTADQLTSYKGLAERWWQYWNNRAVGYRSISTDRSCLIIPKVCKRVVASRVPTQWVYTNQCVIIKEFCEGALAVLLSGLFSTWAETMSGSYMGNGVRIDLGKAVLTFPPPHSPVGGDAINAAARFQEAAFGWCAMNRHGYTELYNKIHDIKECSEEILQMREYLALIDMRVAEVYGATDSGALVRPLGRSVIEDVDAVEARQRSLLLQLVRRAYDAHSRTTSQGGVR